MKYGLLIIIPDLLTAMAAARLQIIQQPLIHGSFTGEMQLFSPQQQQQQQQQQQHQMSEWLPEENLWMEMGKVGNILPPALLF